MKENNLPDRDFAYYLTLFTLEGHRTWRAHLTGNRDGFKEEQQKNWGKKGPKVTKIHTIRIDRITGQIQPLPDERS